MVLGTPSAPPQPALQAQGVTVARGLRDVVMGVDLTVRAHDVVALIGPNGSGKTTLLKALAGLLPCQGQVFVQGQALHALDRRERARLVAYVPQQSALDAPLPVYDVVAQGRMSHTSSLGALASSDRVAIEQAVQAADVAHLLRRPFNALSHGEKHRVLIARGLATQAPLLLLDEPTAGLDIEHVLSLLALLSRLAQQGQAVLVVLHPLAEVQSVASQVAVLSHGSVVAHGSTASVLTESLVQEVYNVRPVPNSAWSFRPL
ncbi:MAG: ABC transporter ATP-binding protein [Deltaproteobacteria bacterium]|nr:ABC transporter ATP-binding protein [Deltaproteobacteria bacterium]